MMADFGDFIQGMYTLWASIDMWVGGMGGRWGGGGGGVSGNNS